MNRLLRWIDARFPLMSTWRAYASDYYVPKNLNFMYYFGSLALVILLMQFVTGLWLTMFYIPSAVSAFDSIEYIMRDVNDGWLLRYMHSTGASAFFIVIYVHIFRALLYGSYQKPRELVWLLGLGLFILLLMEAFFGYLLPWGQMSYWGAQVITSLFTAIPYVGEGLVTWLRGDYHVASSTLQRFFALHVVAVPLLFVFFTYLHIVALHKVGSNNPEGIEIKNHCDQDGRPLDGIPFHPYYTLKDFVGVLIFLMAFFSVVFFYPEMGGYFLEPDNFVPANPMITPSHITPVWYMTPFYAMLRVVPDKLCGIVVLISSVLVLCFVPWLDKSPVRSIRYKGLYSRLALFLFVLSFIVLGLLGSIDLNPMRQWLARVASFIYFAYFLLMPWYTRMERTKRPPERLS